MKTAKINTADKRTEGLQTDRIFISILFHILSMVMSSQELCPRLQIYSLKKTSGDYIIKSLSMIENMNVFPNTLNQ